MRGSLDDIGYTQYSRWHIGCPQHMQSTNSVFWSRFGDAGIPVFAFFSL